MVSLVLEIGQDIQVAGLGLALECVAQPPSVRFVPSRIGYPTLPPLNLWTRSWKVWMKKVLKSRRNYFPAGEPLHPHNQALTSHKLTQNCNCSYSMPGSAIAGVVRGTGLLDGGAVRVLRVSPSDLACCTTSMHVHLSSMSRNFWTRELMAGFSPSMCVFITSSEGKTLPQRLKAAPIGLENCFSSSSDFFCI